MKVDINDLIKQITKSNLDYDGGYCDDHTFEFYIRLTKDISNKFVDLLENSDGTFSPTEDIQDLFVVYWTNKDEYYYYFIFEDDTINVTDSFSCEYLNNMVLQKYKEIKIL